MKRKHCEYKEMFLEIRKLLNKIDPEGLEPGKKNGAPIDEYDPVVNRLVKYVLHYQENIKINNELLLAEINKIWREDFDNDCSAAEEIAVSLLKVIF